MSRGLVKGITRGPWGITQVQGGAAAAGGGGPSGPAEFDIDGATYYAVAPAGYSYSTDQNTQYDTRKHNTLAAAATAVQADHGFTTPVVINVIGDWTSAGPEIVAGATYIGDASATVTNYYLARAIGDARHTGIWNETGAPHSLQSTTAAANTIWVNGPFMYFDGLQVAKNVAGSGAQSAVLAWTSANNCRLSNCIIKGSGDGNNSVGIKLYGTNFTMWNCIAYGWYRSNNSNTAGVEISSFAAGDVNIYSCTFYINSDVGIKRDASSTSTVTCKNCWVMADYATPLAYYGTITKVTCASDDTTGSAGLQNIAYDVATFTNVTTGSEDYSLAGDSPLLATGTDTTGDTAPLDFTTNIAGATRSSWNVGAF